MDRRTFLGVAGLSTVAVAIADCGGRADAGSLARPELLAALGDKSVRAIGARYRAMIPGEGDVDALRPAINGSRPLAARIFGTASPGIAQLVRDDFAHGHTVVVDGWLLSVTEARQCALYSLLSA